MPSATSNNPTDLRQIITQLQHSLSNPSPSSAQSLLTQSKLALLQSNALVPSPNVSPQTLAQALQILELGALISIRLRDSDGFTRYYQQLQGFYDVPDGVKEEVSKHYKGERGKVVGCYLLLLLTREEYGAFHTVLEGLEASSEGGKASGRGKRVEDEELIAYPVRLESALMEGAYDRVWRETRREMVPCEEFGIFSDTLIHTIRSQVASCSEKAYSSIPVANAKNLLFLDSEGAVVEFGQERGWTVQDGRVYFPVEEDDERRGDGMSGTIIENALGYARELETIV
ncbi:MAG: hypothetical protein Q9162_001598 [Coniocarpon cinnabarinum]